MTPEVKKRINDINHGIVPEGYKKTKVGIVPQEWNIKKLGDFCETIGGGTPSTKIGEYWKGDIPWISSSDLKEDNVYDICVSRFITEEAIQNSATNICPPDSILLVSRVGVGKIAFSKCSICTSQDFTNIVDYHADKLYLVYSLYFKMKKEANNTQGTSIKGIVVNEIKQFLMILPPLEEQQKIASILSSQDKLIFLQEQKAESLKKLKKAYLQKMFPQNGSKYPELRFKGFTDAWEQRKLGEIGTVQTCKRIFKEETSEKGDIPFFKNGTLGLQPDAYITRERYDELKQLYPYPEIGDTLISVVGSIGRTAVYTGKDEYFQDSNIVWLKTNGNINKKYLRTAYDVIKWLIEGSTVKHLYNDNILQSVICFPNSQVEQEKIADFFIELDNTITLHQCKLEAEKKKKKSLMQLLLTGKVRCDNV